MLGSSLTTGVLGGSDRLMVRAYAFPGRLVQTQARPAVTVGPWPEEARDLSTQCYEIFRNVVREIAAAGRLRSGSAESAAQALWMACHGVVALLSSRPNFDWEDREELIAVTLDGLLNGLVVD